MRTFEIDPDTPALAQAASLALALLRTSNADTWASLVADPAPLSAVLINPGQVELLDRFAGELTALRVGPPLITLAVCPECQRYTVVSGGPATSCPMTLGCAGKPVKATFATRTETEDLFAAHL